jgi:ParB family chromosome partitioning protein
MAKKAGLGRGLDALFADAAPIFEEEPAAEETSEDTTGDDSSPKKAASKKAAPKKAATAKTGAKTAGTKDDVPPEEDDRVLYIDINDIRPNSAQPRRNFDEEKLKELASSIRTNGVIQPLIVRESTGGYELVAGERRWRASRQAGLRTVPCIIRNFDDKQNAIVAIIENMQREDLDPIEEALGLKSMTETYGFTQEQVSASLGRSRTYITNTIRLLKLPEEIQHYVSTGQMSAAHGRTIINIPDKKRQMEVAEKIIKNDLSVRATEKLAEKVKDELRPERKKRKKKVDSATAASAEIQAVERELMSLTGTKVRIAGNEAMGKIELEYYSLEELNRLIEVFRDAFK